MRLVAERICIRISSAAAAAPPQDPGRSIQPTTSPAIPDTARTAPGPLQSLAAAWPKLRQVMRCGKARSRASLRTAAAELLAEERVTFGRALLSKRAGSVDDIGLSEGEQSYQRCVALRDACAAGTVMEWYWPQWKGQELQSQMELLIGRAGGRVASGPEGPHHPGSLQLGPSSPGLACIQPIFFMALSSGWTLTEALDGFGTLGAGRYSVSGRVFLCDSGRSEPAGTRWPVAFQHGTNTYEVCTSDRTIKWVKAWYCMPGGSGPWGCLTPRKRRPDGTPVFTRFLPDFIRLPTRADGSVKYPENGAAFVVEAEQAWLTRVQGLDSTTRAIVSGRLVIPRLSWPERRVWGKNHDSWELNDDAKRALGPKLAEYIDRGVFEWVSPDDPFPPVAISPLAAVDKSSPPWWRLIADARRPNEGVADWPVKYTTAAELGMLLEYGDYLFAEDLDGAYHNSCKPGCNSDRTWVTVMRPGPDGAPSEFRRLSVGCTSKTCLGYCDRSMAGVRVEGQLYRICCAHFGEKTAGSPLACLVNAFRRHVRARRSGWRPTVVPGEGSGAIFSVAWCDDTVYVVKNERHGTCGGEASLCATCLFAKTEGTAAQAFVREESRILHLKLADDKRQVVSQRVTYTGVIIDTIAGRLFCPEIKRLGVLVRVGDLASGGLRSARALAGVRGKLLHYANCIPYIRVYAVYFSTLIGTEADPDWDRPVLLPPDIATLAGEIMGIVERNHPLGQPLWPLVPSSLFALFRGEGPQRTRARQRAGTRKVILLEWDSSPYGWGGYLHWDDTKELLIGTFETVDDAQVRREAMGGLLMLQAAALLTDCHGAVILHRNDAVGALAALRKGSFRSPELQSIAMRFNTLAESLQSEHYFLHSPGVDLIADGIDDASRDGALQLLYPACTMHMRKLLAATAEAHGWRLSLDLFATEANAVTPRYFARFAEPGCEACDAWSVTSWGESRCPACKAMHREVVLAFPPLSLIRRFVQKADADAVRGLAVVPFAPMAAYWPRLLRAAVPHPRSGHLFHRLRTSGRLLEGDAKLNVTSIAVFAVDFGQGPLAGTDGPRALTTPCAGAFDRRGRLALRSHEEQQDQDAAKAALDAHLRDRADGPFDRSRHAALGPPGGGPDQRGPSRCGRGPLGSGNDAHFAGRGTSPLRPSEGGGR